MANRKFAITITYIEEEDLYIGKGTNVPGIIAQAKTKEKLEIKLLKMSKTMLDLLSSQLENGIHLYEVESSKF